MKKFYPKKFFISNAIYGICNVSFISILLVPFLRTRISDQLQLSTTISAMDISMFIFMYIGGILFDRFGARFTFLFGRIIDIISISLLLFNNYYTLLLAVILQGFARGIIYGKYTSYIYNILSANDKLHLYGRFASGYYFCWDIACSGCAFIAKLLLKDYGYELLICLSIVLKIVSYFVVFITIPSKKNIKNQADDLSSFQVSSIKEIFTTFIKCAKSNKLFTYLILFYGWLQYFTYPFAVVIGDMILLDIGWTQPEVASFTATLFTIMSVGTLIPLFLFPNPISVEKSVIISIAQLLLLFVSLIIYNDKMLVFVLWFMGLTFCLFETSLEKNFEKVSNKQIRGSVISVSTSLMNILKIFNVMLFGIIAKRFSHHIGGIVISGLLFFTALYLTIQIIKNRCLLHKVSNEV